MGPWLSRVFLTELQRLPTSQVLEDSRQILVAANMQPNDPFPMDDKIKEGLPPPPRPPPPTLLFRKPLPF